MNRRRILLVDDDETLLDTFKTILQSKGFVVDTATTGGQAIKKNGEKQFDLIVLDIKLPDIMGDEVARAIKTKAPQTPIVLITGNSSFQESIDALDLGVHEILLKPVSVEEIIRVINEAAATA